MVWTNCISTVPLTTWSNSQVMLVLHRSQRCFENSPPKWLFSVITTACHNLSVILANGDEEDAAEQVTYDTIYLGFISVTFWWWSKALDSFCGITASAFLRASVLVTFLEDLTSSSLRKSLKLESDFWTRNKHTGKRKFTIVVVKDTQWSWLIKTKQLVDWITQNN